MNKNIKTFFIIRHADKESGVGYNPPLSARGRARANNWINVFMHQPVDIIFVTPLLRVRQTFEPLAQIKNIPITEYDTYEMENLIDSIFYNPAYNNIIIGGHQDTVPIIANLLLGENKFSHIANDDYDNLITVMTDKENFRKYIHLNIPI